MKLKQSVVEEADESESESERTMRGFKLTEGRRFNASGISVLEDIDWNEQ
jgi:hypothetical protein